MDKKKLVNLLQDKKIQDYSYITFFFLIFSIFLFFAIRPNIITAFSLRKELQELKLKDREAEETIMQIVNYQSVVETQRDKLKLLDEALPSSPGLAKAVEDVRQTASDSGFLVSNMDVDSVEFIDENGEGELKTFNINLGAEATTEQLNTFILKILNQRRLKDFDTVKMFVDENSKRTVNLIIKNYYL